MKLACIEHGRGIFKSLQKDRFFVGEEAIQSETQGIMSTIIKTWREKHLTPESKRPQWVEWVRMWGSEEVKRAIQIKPTTTELLELVSTVL